MFKQFLEIVRENYRFTLDSKILQENAMKSFIPINLETDKTRFSRTMQKSSTLY